MIQTIHDYYPHVVKKSVESGRLSSSVHRDLDVWWNQKEKNFIVCLKGKKDILLEFLTHQQIRPDLVRDALNRLDRGGVFNLKKDLTLGGIAAMARKEKAEEDFKAEERKHLRDADKYESEGKRNIALGV